MRVRLPGFGHAVWWRLTRGATAWLWIPGTLGSMWMANSRGRPAMWEDGLLVGSTNSMVVITTCALVAALMTGADRHSYLTGQRYAARPVANHLAVVIACSLQAWVGVVATTAVVLAHFAAVQTFRPFSPMQFFVALAWAWAYCGFGALFGSLLPRWVSLPIVPIIAWTACVFPGDMTDTWPGLFTYADNGFFAPFDSEPRGVVLFAQVLIAVAIAGALTALPVVTRLRRPQLVSTVAVVTACAIGATAILSQTGPVRGVKQFVPRPVYCEGRVCSVADRTYQIRVMDSFLRQHPQLLERFGIPMDARFVDDPAPAHPGDIQVTLLSTTIESVGDDVLEALIVYHWCGAARQGEVAPAFAPFYASLPYVASWQKHPADPPPPPAAPKNLTCSAR